MSVWFWFVCGMIAGIVATVAGIWSARREQGYQPRRGVQHMPCIPPPPPRPNPPRFFDLVVRPGFVDLGGHKEPPTLPKPDTPPAGQGPRS